MTKTADKKPAAKKPATRKKQAEDSLERIFELIDERVVSRGQHVLGQLDDTEAIVDLVERARNKGATMPDLAKRVKRMDKASRKLGPITRQALDAMLNADHDTSRRDARTEESRRRAEEMHAFHREGHSLKETGERFGQVSPQTVSALFSRHGLAVQRGRRSTTRSNLNTEALA